MFRHNRCHHHKFSIIMQLVSKKELFFQQSFIYFCCWCCSSVELCLINLYNGLLQAAGFKIKWKWMFSYIRKMGYEPYVKTKNGFTSPRFRTDRHFCLLPSVSHWWTVLNVNTIPLHARVRKWRICFCAGGYSDNVRVIMTTVIMRIPNICSLLLIPI
jgi:hypothetical protein